MSEFVNENGHRFSPAPASPIPASRSPAPVSPASSVPGSAAPVSADVPAAPPAAAVIVPPSSVAVPSSPAAPSAPAIPAPASSSVLAVPAPTVVTAPSSAASSPLPTGHFMERAPLSRPNIGPNSCFQTKARPTTQNAVVVWRAPAWPLERAATVKAPVAPARAQVFDSVIIRSRTVSGAGSRAAATTPTCVNLAPPAGSVPVSPVPSGSVVPASAPSVPVPVLSSALAGPTPASPLSGASVAPVPVSTSSPGRAVPVPASPPSADPVVPAPAAGSPAASAVPAPASPAAPASAASASPAAPAVPVSASLSSAPLSAPASAPATSTPVAHTPVLFGVPERPGSAAAAVIAAECRGLRPAHEVGSPDASTPDDSGAASPGIPLGLSTAAT
ncbi:hypothetical protein KEM55_003074 [Ascosphaera atra]|nr:hypothetical protein KEM55_003074 [Ascosphaera atra]